MSTSEPANISQSRPVRYIRPGNGWRMGDQEQREGEGDTALKESRPELKRPPLYKVVLINDDYTPMEFVVEVLEIFFRMNREQATHVMLTVHTQGKGVCGISPATSPRPRQPRSTSTRGSTSTRCCARSRPPRVSPTRPMRVNRPRRPGVVYAE